MNYDPCENEATQCSTVVTDSAGVLTPVKNKNGFYLNDQVNFQLYQPVNLGIWYFRIVCGHCQHLQTNWLRFDSFVTSKLKLKSKEIIFSVMICLLSKVRSQCNSFRTEEMQFFRNGTSCQTFLWIKEARKIYKIANKWSSDSISNWF